MRNIDKLRHRRGAAARSEVPVGAGQDERGPSICAGVDLCETGR